MWLINTETLELEEFTNHPKNQYAILSHRWEENEVTFRGWATNKEPQRKGYHKIMRFVQKAAERGFKYAWADTCCINKESSAELSEAINSMFKYYKDSAECYIYLSDLPPLIQSRSGSVIHSTNNTTISIEDSRSNAFVKSKWFTRGWTLQELIAPRTVYFFDSNWKFYGRKRDLKGRIEYATGIPESIIIGSQRIQDCSIACRMSWAASRQTTRIEDMAYCLLGIFEIHMPLLYGEGQEAFIRLQEEICKKTTDMSLFAWKTVRSSDLYSGLLARSPSNFRDSAKVAPSVWAPQTDFSDEIAITNRGIRFDNMTLYISTKYGVLLDLNCWNKGKGASGNVFVCLSRTLESWVRFKANEIICLDGNACTEHRPFEVSRIFICKTVEPGSLRSSDLYHHYTLFDFSPGTRLIAAEPSRLWDFYMSGFMPNQHLSGAVHILTKQEECEPEEFLILCGILARDAEGDEILDWRQRYRFTTLSQKHGDFREVRDLVRAKVFHSRQGRDKASYYLNKNANESCWNKKDRCFFDNIAIGIRYRISVKGKVVSTRGADGASYDMVKFYVRSQKI